MNTARSISLGSVSALLVALVPACNRGARTEAPGPAQSSTEVRPVSVEKINRVTLANGLVIEDLNLGDGAVCLPGMKIRVQYTGSIAPDPQPSSRPGRVFDSSNGERQIDLGGNIIRGWKDGLPGMRAGGKRRLTIPPLLGYGDRDIKSSAGEVVIPANSTLVYEIELLSVE